MTVSRKVPQEGGPRFHVLNGGATLAILREAAVPGESVVFPDMLMEGPLPRGRDGRLDWAARASFLAARFGVPRAPALARMRAFVQAFDSALASGGEVTLWFEEDFFCQVHLAYLLATLPASARKRVRVICSAKPLGHLSPKDLERRYARRLPLDPACAALSKKVWAALSRPAAPSGRHGLSAEARAAWAAGGRAEALLADRQGFAAWPRLRAGLKAQLDRRPGVDGLGSLEKAILAALPKAGKPLPFAKLFPSVARHPRIKALGLGDLQVARCALDLARLQDSPLRIQGAGKGDKALEGFQRWKLALAR